MTDNKYCMSNTPFIYSSNLNIWPNLKVENIKWSLDQATVPGLILEFGVSVGSSIKAIAQHRPDYTIYGFDTFTGLPDSWGPYKPGAYTTNGVLPEVPANVTLVPGLYTDTLPVFTKSTVSFIHIDCDSYMATKTVFDELGEYIVPGTVIVFDEFIDPDWDEKQEYHAFMEFIEASGKKYEIISIIPGTKKYTAIIR